MVSCLYHDGGWPGQVLNSRKFGDRGYSCCSQEIAFTSPEIGNISPIGDHPVSRIRENQPGLWGGLTMAQSSPIERFSTGLSIAGTLGRWTWRKTPNAETQRSGSQEEQQQAASQCSATKFRAVIAEGAYPVYPHTPARGELTTGRHISSPHSCAATHASQSQPSPFHAHSVQI